MGVRGIEQIFGFSKTARFLLDSFFIIEDDSTLKTYFFF